MESLQNQTLTVGGEEFAFELCRNPEMDFGDATVDQWWMPVTQLYAQRQQGGSAKAITEASWTSIGRPFAKTAQRTSATPRSGTCSDLSCRT